MIWFMVVEAKKGTCLNERGIKDWVSGEIFTKILDFGKRKYYTYFAFAKSLNFL